MTSLRETRQAPTAGRLPADPEAFVRAAEQITNERTLDALPTLYAADAVFTSTTDGMVVRAQGVEEITQTWRVLFSFLKERDFSLTKRMLIAAHGVLVSEWTGSLAGRTHATGIEVWCFDSTGLISEHTMYSYLNTGPDSSRVQRLRLLASYPATAIALLRARRRSAR
jgi:nuclear transport factor 2 (NTF2) superfamily protein